MQTTLADIELVLAMDRRAAASNDNRTNLLMLGEQETFAGSSW